MVYYAIQKYIQQTLLPVKNVFSSVTHTFCALYANIQYYFVHYGGICKVQNGYISAIEYKFSRHMTFRGEKNKCYVVFMRSQIDIYRW